MSWDFFVRHYPNDTREAMNSKATYASPSGGEYIGLNPPPGSTLKGIWYPRAATLGGCSAHNALVTVYPHEEDWTFVEAITGDSTWSADNMRTYWERLERNEYLNPTGTEAAGHGFNGWLGTSEMDDSLIDQDPQMLALIAAAKTVVEGTPFTNITDAADLDATFPLDMNTAYPNRDSTQSLYRMPMAVSRGVRSSSRDFLLATTNAVNADGSKKYQLDIRLNAFVTKINFANDPRTGTPRAVGVNFMDGQSLYTADSRNNASTTGTSGHVNAIKEVIISAGAFNTPQILKLSGVGPAAELASFNIPVIVDLPGVGANLEDHYEISTIIEYDQSHPFKLFSDCTFLTPGTTDACYTQYASGQAERGPYATNLLPATAIVKSSVSLGERDTFIFGGPVNFRGYFQGYTAETIADTLHWTWAVLKAHTNNFAGAVTLKSANPFDTPAINFNFFDAGTTILGADEIDIRPLVEAVRLTRDIYKTLPSAYRGTFEEVYPGANITTTEDVKTFIRNEAWSHHASSTARIGADWDPYAVLDSHFRVRGVEGLRVVDASSLPRVPGFFPVTSVYMIGEKAADVILADNA
jgi:choline dehydrogenase